MMMTMVLVMMAMMMVMITMVVVVVVLLAVVMNDCSGDRILDLKAVERKLNRVPTFTGDNQVDSERVPLEELLLFLGES